MEIKTHLENHGINVHCCVGGQGYELMPDDIIPRTHEACWHGEHLGVICCDCFMAGDAWLRTMLELPADEPILRIWRPRYLDIMTGHFEASEDQGLACDEAIADDESEVIIHLQTDQQGNRIVRLSHRRCQPEPMDLAVDAHTCAFCSLIPLRICS